MWRRMSHQIDAEFIAQNTTTDTDVLQARLDNALVALRNLQEAANNQVNAAEGRPGWMSADWVKDRCYWAIKDIEG